MCLAASNNLLTKSIFPSYFLSIQFSGLNFDGCITGLILFEQIRSGKLNVKDMI